MIEDKIIIDANGCHVWVGATTPAGYGCLRAGGKQWMAHRYFWTKANGPIPENMIICHHCDNPPCVNKDHLFIGTTADNVQDKMKKGRHRFGVNSGESHGRAKLSIAEVTKIKEMGLDKRVKYSRGYAISAIAKQYGVSRGTIYKIVNGTNWSAA